MAISTTKPKQGKVKVSKLSGIKVDGSKPVSQIFHLEKAVT
jgi:hypothetical protein